MSNPETKSNMPPPEIFAIMGRTGSGKSTFINLLCGREEMEVGHGLQSCTADVKVTPPMLLNGRVVCLIDTPGFDDTVKSEAEILTTVANFFAATFEAGTKINGILFFHQISDTRVGGTSRKTIRLFHKLCGKDAMKQVVIVTNLWGKVTPEEGALREQDLAESELFFKTALDHGARMVRHDNTLESASRIVQGLMGAQPETLAIQHEMVVEKKEVAQTAAGEDLRSELEALKQEHEKELEMLKAEMKVLMVQKDEQHKEEIQTLEDDLRAVRNELEEVRKSKERLQKEHPAERFCYQELAKRLAEDLKDRNRLRGLLEKADIREAWMMEELRQGNRTRKSSNFWMTAVGCVLGAGAMVVTQDVNTAMRIATVVARSAFSQNTTYSMEDYVPKSLGRSFD